MNLENVLPMIDFNEISSIVIKEERKQIIRSDLSKKKSGALKQVDNLIEEVKSLETSSHPNETCSSSICDDNLKSGLSMTLIHGQYLPEEKTSPIDEIIKHKPEEINVSKAKISTERVENV